MNIVVASNFFSRDEKRFDLNNFQIEWIKLPIDFTEKYCMKELVALRLYHLENACDRLICLDIEMLLLKHLKKYYFCRQENIKYFASVLNNDELSIEIKEYVLRAIQKGLNECIIIYFLSKEAEILLYDIGLEVSDVPFKVYDMEQFEVLINK